MVILQGLITCQSDERVTDMLSALVILRVMVLCVLCHSDFFKIPCGNGEME